MSVYVHYLIFLPHLNRQRERNFIIPDISMSKSTINLEFVFIHGNSIELFLLLNIFYKMKILSTSHGQHIFQIKIQMNIHMFLYEVLALNLYKDLISTFISMRITAFWLFSVC